MAALRLRLTLLAPERRTLEGHVGEGLASLDGADPGNFAAAGLPARLARLVELGPRPRREQPELVVVVREAIECHLAAGRACDAGETRAALELPAEAPDDLAAALGALPTAVRRRWSVVAWDDAVGDAATVHLETLDAGDHGYWQLLPGAAGVTAVVASSAAVLWHQLVAIRVAPSRKSA